MKTAGIIAEYNPFHSGHAYHIRELRAAGADRIAVVMSGNAVQRGDFAVADKRVRARAALENGADLVLCLPEPWSCANAATFAMGGVGMLNALGCVDMLGFGSESGDINALKNAAELLKCDEFSQLLKAELARGITFAAARENAVTALDPSAATVLGTPNDILAIEYLGALNTLASDMQPVAIKRVGAEHDGDGGDGFCSAMQLREQLLNNEFPEKYLPTAELLYTEIKAGKAPASLKNAELGVLCVLRQCTAERIALSPDVSEGIENRLYGAIRAAANLEELYATAKTKRYTHARIRRLVMNTFLGITAKDAQGLPPYLRVLGFNQTGREILHDAREKSTLPVITRPGDIKSLGEKAKRIADIERITEEMMALAVGITN